MSWYSGYGACIGVGILFRILRFRIKGTKFSKSTTENHQVPIKWDSNLIKDGCGVSNRETTSNAVKSTVNKAMRTKSRTTEIYQYCLIQFRNTLR